MADEADYLSAVGRQIRWRRARGPLLRELNDHITDQACAFEGAGEAPADAMAHAVREMGDPAEVGRALDRLHRPKNRWEIVLFVALALCIGLALQYLLLSGAGYGQADLQARWLRQACGVLLGAAAMVGVWFCDYTRLFQRRYLAPLALALVFGGCVFSLFLTARTQPHLFYSPATAGLTLLLPVAFAGVLCLLRGGGGLVVLLCACVAPLLTVPALLIPSISAALHATAAMLLTLGLAVWMRWFRCNRLVGLLLAWGPGAAAAAVFLLRRLSHPRLALFFHPQQDPTGGGYLFSMLRSGQGAALSTLDYQLALAQLIGRFGWGVPAVALLGVALFSLLLLRRIRGLRSGEGRLLAFGAACALVLQALCFVLYNCGWLPFSPLSFPFLSYGVVFMVCNLALVGVLLSVFRMDALARPCPGFRLRPPDGVAFSLLGGLLYVQWRRKTE